MKNPCKECPFKKASAPGYLGELSHQPDEYIEALEYPTPIPCHMSIDWEPDEEGTVDCTKAKVCAGAMQFMNNSCKRTRYYPLVQSGYGKNKNVFGTRQEFIKHHNGN